MEIAENQSRKLRKRSLGEQNTLSIDRLSSLPDSVLCHILSFLRTKNSVRTSILGKRWRYLWSYVQTLDFEDENQEIINRFMLLRKVQSINTFRLFHRIECSAYQLETWVSFAIVRNVQKLYLCFSSQIALPGCLFTCKTLVDLRLFSCGVIPTSDAVCLPYLKKLYLVNVQYEADESLPHLLSGCPVLEELSINSYEDIAYCKVSSPTIKKLMINLTSNNRRNRVEINTPAVGYLEISDTLSKHIESGALNSVVEADIELQNFDKKQEDVLHSRTVLDFVSRLCNVKRLKLDLAYDTKIIDSLLCAWTISFRNLTELELKADCRFLFKMLENADNLEILTFTEFSAEMEGLTEPPQQVPTCLLSHLRIVELVGIVGEMYELEMIRYLLRNSQVLERMKIAYDYCLGSEEKFNMLQEISLFQRGSTACEVAFVRNCSMLDF